MRQLVAQLSTLNTRRTEVRLLEKTLSKEDIRKYSKFETLATSICDQQDALEAARRRYDEPCGILFHAASAVDA